jgi:hypothetical protein
MRAKFRYIGLGSSPPIPGDRTMYSMYSDSSTTEENGKPAPADNSHVDVVRHLLGCDPWAPAPPAPSAPLAPSPPATAP